MYCPKCLTEYRDGFLECADCHVALAPGLPPQLATGPSPQVIAGPHLQAPDNGELALITVLETDDRFALSLATAALEDGGIEYLVAGETAEFDEIPCIFGSGQSRLYNCPCRIQVAPESEAEAREILERFQEPLSAAEIEGEVEPDGQAND